MKANINLEIDKEDLNYELKELIRSISSDEVKRMVKLQAEEMVKEEVKRIIAPIVDGYLENARVGREHISHHENATSRRDVDSFIKSILINYLDERVYVYSKDAEKISERYGKGTGSDKTRAELWIIDKTIKYVDKEVFGKLEKKLQEVADVIVPNEEKMQEMIRAEVMKKFG